MTHTSNADYTHYYPKMRAAHLDRQCAVSYTSMSQTKRNNADLWQLAKIHLHPTVNACTTLHTWPQNRSQWFLRIKPIDMSCSTNKNSAKLMTAEIKTDHTRFHKSKFCPVRNRPKLWNLTNDHERVNKNFQDISKQIHSGLSLTALCTAFCILHTATADRPCQSLVL